MPEPHEQHPERGRTAPTPKQIHRRAVAEGDRRLRMSLLDLVATGFNAGFTIVLGIAALAAVVALVEPTLGRGIAKIAGAAAFATGLVFLTTSRSELFTENFFDPVATAFDRRRESVLPALLRLWFVVLAMNLVGGALLAGADLAVGTIGAETLVAVAGNLVGGLAFVTLTHITQARAEDRG